MQNLYFSTDKNPRSNLVVGLGNLSPAQPQARTFGENVTTNIYLLSQSAPVNGGYDAISGSASYTLRVGLGTPGGLPTAGTFTLTFGGQTTSALAYNSTAAQIQTALQALSSIGANNCLVTGSFPAFDVMFTGTLGDAAQTLMTANSTGLLPRSAVLVGNEQTGSGTQNSIQSVELGLMPAVLQTTWAAITSSVASGLPTSGTYTLTFGGQTTSGIAYNATAATIQTALQGLSTIGSGNALVTGQYPIYQVQFAGALSDTTLPLITANPASLSTGGAVSIVTTQIGSGAASAIQTVTLSTQTSVNIGWTGYLGFNTAQLLEMFGPNQSQISPTLEFWKIDGSGNKELFAAFPVTIYAAVVSDASIGDGPFTNSASGSFNIANGSDNGAVTGLGLSAVPRLVLLQVTKPSGGLNLFATVVQGTITTGGFTFNLNGLTDASTYVLDYTLIF